MPQDLHPYFFFNGERLEKSGGIRQSSQVRDAIRKLLGVEWLERAIYHLSKLQRRYRNQLVDESNKNSELKKALERISSLEDEMYNYDSAEKAEKSKLTEINDDIDHVDEKLKQLEESKRYVNRRKVILSELDIIDGKVKELKKEQNAKIDRLGFLQMSKELVSKCSKIVEDGRRKGQIPYQIKTQFIDDLVERGKCICGNKIENGGREYHSLLLERQTAGTEQMDDTYTSVSSFL